MKLYVIRHGQTDWNLIDKIQGQTDIPLNKTGMIQAKEARDKIQKLDFDLIICSPLKRAKQTAGIINQNKNVEIIYDEALIERSLGSFEGTQSNLDDFPISNLKINSEINNIETAKQLYNRVSKLLDNIKNNLRDKKILLVTHGGTIRAIETYFFGTDESGNMPPETIKNCEIREYIFKN